MIQSVERALNILQHIAENKGDPVPLGELARKGNLNKSTAAHLVDTLKKCGYVHQVSRSQGYVLGGYAYYLTRYKKFHDGLISTCKPVIRWIQKTIDNTVLLAVLAENHKFVVSYAEDLQGDVPLRDRGEMFLGTLYASATGRILLAHIKPGELRQLVQEIGLPSNDTWPDIDSLQSLQTALQKIRAQKVIFIRKPDEISFAAYVGNGGAIGIPVRVSQEYTLSPEKMALIEKTLLRGTREIQRRMRFGKDPNS